MIGYRLLYLASLVTFSFGALTFSALLMLYVRQGGARKNRASVLPVFTLICGLSFLINLAFQIASAAGGEIGPALSLALDATTSLIPPCLVHLVYAPEARHLRGARLWRWLVYLLYPISLAIAVVESELSAAPAVALGSAALLALLMQSLSPRNLSTLERNHRWWTRVILISIAASSAIYLIRPDLFLGLLPDYLVLALFAITLYYEERPIFFDLLIKRGVCSRSRWPA